MPTQVEICLTVSRFSAEPRPPPRMSSTCLKKCIYNWGMDGVGAGLRMNLPPADHIALRMPHGYTA
jgi:hypothetical protein